MARMGKRFWSREICRVGSPLIPKKFGSSSSQTLRYGDLFILRGENGEFRWEAGTLMCSINLCNSCLFFETNFRIRWPDVFLPFGVTLKYIALPVLDCYTQCTLSSPALLLTSLALVLLAPDNILAQASSLERTRNRSAGLAILGCRFAGDSGADAPMLASALRCVT